MQLYTTWTAYGGKVGITQAGEFFEMDKGIKLNRVYHQGAIYYRANRSNIRYSRKKIIETKKRQRKEIIIIPF